MPFGYRAFGSYQVTVMIVEGRVSEVYQARDTSRACWGLR